MSESCAVVGMHAIHGMQPYGSPTAFDFDIHVEIPANSRNSAQDYTRIGALNSPVRRAKAVADCEEARA
ncbi:MAG: hypothetical protein WC966_02240 [Bradymonadales bacterium]